MDVDEAISTRLELKEYSDDPVDEETIAEILDAGRQSPSGRNLQHWRYVVLDDQEDLDRLADLSPSGRWVADTAFAVVVLTDPDLGYHEIDAGRTITHMQFAAWARGVGSRLYTVSNPEVREFLEVPDDYALTAVVGFGYPKTEVRGLKDRDPLSRVAFRGRYGRDLNLPGVE